MTLDFKALEDKWQSRWAAEHVFEADPGDKEKFFLNLPYPYMNGFLHIGRMFTYLRGDVLARYKRMNGYNVLFPFSFHCTGSPIVNAAKRIANGEEKQTMILEKMGVEKELIPKFSDPEYWTEYFPKHTKQHLKDMGMSIDWRRSFITTSLNPHYDRFIQWQFKTLKKKGLVVKGAHPVIWCSDCQNAVSDHSRLEGEGETPQEFTLLKFAYGDMFIIAATLRPETVYGQTNLWVDPEQEYVIADVNEEKWIVSEECAKKLADQDKDVRVAGRITGREMIGKSALAPEIDRQIIILPSGFCDPSKGTGIVTSVPSDAPDDWMGIQDLLCDKELREKYGLSVDDIESIEVIPIITSKGWGPLPAKEICEKMGIKTQHDREKLTTAKKEIYKSGFYTGVMNDNCRAFSGMNVEEAKVAMKKKMIDDSKADIMYEPSGNVVCRCLSKCTVKIVKDQYFLDYSNPEWKEKTHKAIANMTFYPDVIRKQFDYVIDWLNSWACTRKVGLGTKLPWDDKWMIESLSDSTIYMAFYTVAHKVMQLDPETVDDSLFDFVFFGEGDPEEIGASIGRDAEFVRSLNEEFEYWYPFDLRSSGKDLVQNHLSFCLFNHTGIFPERHWPRAMGVNGWLMIDKEKMSSSKGNVFITSDMREKYGSDVVRLGLMFSGEGIDDPNWETSFVETAVDRLESWHEFATVNYGRGREDFQYIDRWFEAMLLDILKETGDSVEQMMYRTTINKGYFDLQRAMKWYLKRTDEPNRELMEKFIEAQTAILSLFCPHTAEEIWESIGKTGFISTSQWPKAWAESDPSMIRAEEYLKGVLDDVKEILKVTKMENPKKIYIYTAPEWKWKVAEIAGHAKDFKDAMQQVMQDPEMRKQGKQVSKFLTEAMKSRTAIEPIDEGEILSQSASFLSSELGADVEIDADATCY